MRHLRVIKTLLVAGVALFAGLVSYNNIVDYGSNYAFVEHVLTMDTTFEGNQLKSRAIESTFLHNLFYWLIIASEGLVSLLCLLGAINMLKALTQDKTQFNQAKKLASIGLFVGIILWFTGFMTIGAEWFLMWQSPIWNGQEGAFRFIVILFLTLGFINQYEDASN
ncbi:DUF2165 domain-containing protein [Psychromonas sp. 14N.309.X.WAT.B.A12]|uniref:DUF2165 family protein n=1 Tax=Psychromonas sp. 14N.309.X.WAT.B.A12 TaxID=2998322 RepID=UPI0025AFF95F|nr:DUF2165 domain-containing protein [Psychromonas sp. 14N.309.X.WAT.B.A12]MDN2662393.1 DUF2165 domain-containing protein [Psychromonas sp. 14N.309.X.WAT.B.A12]